MTSEASKKKSPQNRHNHLPNQKKTNQEFWKIVLIYFTEFFENILEFIYLE